MLCYDKQSQHSPRDDAAATPPARPRGLHVRLLRNKEGSYTFNSLSLPLSISISVYVCVCLLEKEIANVLRRERERERGWIACVWIRVFVQKINFAAKTRRKAENQFPRFHHGMQKRELSQSKQHLKNGFKRNCRQVDRTGQHLTTQVNHTFVVAVVVAQLAVVTVASDTRGTQFASSHWQKFILNIFTVNS